MAYESVPAPLLAWRTVTYCTEIEWTSDRLALWTAGVWMDELTTSVLIEQRPGADSG